MEHERFVYVLDQEGNPLMPTKRYGWVRRALKSGRAQAVRRKPFTIRLCYEPETHEVQSVVLGVDPGRTNIGLAAVREDGTCLYNAQCRTRNKDIPKLMRERKAHRSASRRGERKCRQRRAKKFRTMFEAEKRMRHIKGYGEDGTMVLNGIINTEARFLNRKRPQGWLTPTATQLLRTHLNLIGKAVKLLPVSRVVLEVNKFAFMELDRPELKHWQIDFQKGPLCQTGGVKDAVRIQQEGQCLLCKKPIDHFHHIVPRSKGGSDTVTNIAGLCAKHHALVHTDAKAAERLNAKRAGLNKKYGALSVLNQIIPQLADALAGQYPDKLSVTYGAVTKAFRDRHRVEKDHDRDAYCIACSVMPEGIAVSLPDPGDYYEIRQFRDHDRAVIKRQTERTYYLDGKKVAANRRKRTEQKEDSLHEWFVKTVKAVGKLEAKRLQSKLAVKKSARAYNRPDRHLPGTVFFVNGRRYVMQGQKNNGFYVYTTNGLSEMFRAKDVVWSGHSGLVYL